MKKSSIIFVIAAVLLGVMYWQRPKPPAPPENQTTTQTLTTQTNQTLPPVQPRVAGPRKPRPARAVSTNVTQQTTLQKPVRPLPEVLQALPAYLKPLVERPGSPPRPELRAQMTTNDQAILVELYQATTNLLDRNALTMALGFIGDEEVVALFKQALTQEYPGQPLTSGYPGTDEEYTLFHTVVALGYLAAKYDSAYEFVKQGTDPWFWHDQIQWSSNRGADTSGMLTSFSIQAIGQSGRPDVPQLLEQLKTKDMVNRVDGDSLGARNYSGSVLQAAFFNDLIQLNGMDAFRNYTLGEGDNDLYKQWRKTENGKKWLAWYETVKRQR